MRLCLRGGAREPSHLLRQLPSGCNGDAARTRTRGWLACGGWCCSRRGQPEMFRRRMRGCTADIASTATALTRRSAVTARQAPARSFSRGLQASGVKRVCECGCVVAGAAPAGGGHHRGGGGEHPPPRRLDRRLLLSVLLTVLPLRSPCPLTTSQMCLAMASQSPHLEHIGVAQYKGPRRESCPWRCWGGGGVLQARLGGRV